MCSKRQRRSGAASPCPARVADAFTRLPDAMARADERAGNVERAVVDLVEAVSLSTEVGELFDAVVMDVDHARRADPALAGAGDRAASTPTG